MRFLSTALLKCLLLTAKPVCRGAAAPSAGLHNTLNGKLENDLPSLNNCSIVFRLLSFSSFLKVYRCFVSNYSKLGIRLSVTTGRNKNVPRNIGGLNYMNQISQPGNQAILFFITVFAGNCKTVTSFFSAAS